MNVLGVSCYFHDASATLVQDGRVVAAAEEERFTRKKHDNVFPENAIRFCLQQARLSATDLDAVCFYEKPLRKLERTLVSAKTWREKSEDHVRNQLSLALHERMWLPEILGDKLGYTGPVYYSEHHLSHAASAYYISDFREAAILTVDGVGEWASTAAFLGNGTQISPLKEIWYPHSLGLLYSTVTAFLGFKVNNDEYKVMGLASYGKPAFTDQLARMIHQFPDGSMALDLSYFSFMYDDNRMYSDKFIELLGEPRLPESDLTQGHMDLAASVQGLLEESMVAIAGGLYHECGCVENLCLAGGVALNCVANSRVLKETPFKRMCIQPAAGDGGCSMGAALYAYYRITGAPKVLNRSHSTLLGPEYSTEEVESYLGSQGALYTRMSEDDLCSRAAELINDNFIIGWFQGRMEFGPRALGCRSILANACNPEMKEILNERVKFREDFRPFAPAVLQEKAQEYFELPFESPHMLFTCDVKTDMRNRIPSVTHTDYSARVQTVSEEDNARFHKLIKAFERISGVPVVINTSFNIRGMPIVCSPADAYGCFLRTDIDFLFIDEFLVRKEA